MSTETDRRVVRASRFAGGLLAEGYTPNATDEEMRAAFAGCVRPVSSDLYPLVRLQAVILEAERLNLI